MDEGGKSACSGSVLTRITGEHCRKFEYLTSLKMFSTWERYCVIINEDSLEKDESKKF